MEEKVQANEVLYRGIKRSQPDSMKQGRPTSALFKQEDSVSVDRDGGRPEDVIIHDFGRRFQKRFKGLVKVGAQVCFDHNMAVIPETEHNLYHAEIFENEDKLPLSSLNALILADNSEVVIYDQNIEWTR